VREITIIFTWSGKQVKVPARIYNDLKHLNARRLLEASSSKPGQRGAKQE
jgi:hypothetical protein